MFFFRWLWLHVKVLLLGLVDSSMNHHDYHDLEYKYARWRNGRHFDFSKGGYRTTVWSRQVTENNTKLAKALSERLHDDSVFRALLGKGDYYLRAVPCEKGVVVAVFPAYHGWDIPDDLKLTRKLEQGGHWGQAWQDDYMFQFIYHDGLPVAESCEGEFFYVHRTRPLLAIKLNDLQDTSITDPAPAYL